MNPAINAEIPYIVDTGEKIVNETFGPNNIHRRRTGTQELKPMEVRDGRPVAGEFALDKNGFIFVEHKTKVRDFFDAGELKSVYYPEVERLIRETSGASRVVLFDHTLRSGDEGERETKLIREPVLSAHNDYTEWSGPNRVREVMGAEADSLLQRRFSII
ncbi:MAG TPA: CmcJ/NvfI family oxidoreductase, partial [Burkholderiales bacterium]|nr:CmcJ/NvfI family oxidoreductase [Burkholderiales bacterium]